MQGSIEVKTLSGMNLFHMSQNLLPVFGTSGPTKGSHNGYLNTGAPACAAVHMVGPDSRKHRAPGSRQCRLCCVGRGLVGLE